jgi:mannose-6-phosphate isomerase-like protein (cupin superfamily)
MLALLFAATVAAAPPFTSLDRTAPETQVRHLSGADISRDLMQAKKPGDFYAQALISKGDHHQVINTIRDSSGQAEVHADWNDHIFVQDGAATLATGGAAVDAKDTAPGEKRGTSIKGGTAMAMKAGDYFFVPAGTPHQMLLAKGQKIKFIAFKTHK